MRTTVSAFAIVFAAVGAAQAHVISIGFENAGAGSVTFWTGSYHGSSNEGSLNLVGNNGNSFPSTTQAFNLLTASKPAGLVDGTTNFFASGDMGGAGPLTNSNTLGSWPGAATAWQGVTFNGLTPGDYLFQYIPIAQPSLNWEPWNPQIGGSQQPLTLSGTVVTGTAVPEPSSIALFGIGMVGLVGYGWRRRRKDTPPTTA